MADEAERASKILENKGMQNDERIDSLDANIIIATSVAIDSSRKMEEASRKLAMTQVNGTKPAAVPACSIFRLKAERPTILLTVLTEN